LLVTKLTYLATKIMVAKVQFFVVVIFLNFLVHIY